MIVVVGDLLVDIFLLSELRCEEQGSGIVLRGGGSAANTAAWLSVLGDAVTFVGCAGDDGLGRHLTEELRSSGVTPWVRDVPGYETGAVVVEVTAEGERAMRSSRGANAALSPDAVLATASLRPAWIHLSGYALLNDDRLQILAACAELARESHGRLSLDPSSCGVISRIGAERMREAITQYEVHLFLPNAREAMALSGESNPMDAARQLSHLAPAVAVKDGPLGAMLGTGGRAESLPTHRIPAVDSTGAGDAFNAGVIHALLQDQSLTEACNLANATAGQVLGHYGGRPAAP